MGRELFLNHKYNLSVRRGLCKLADFYLKPHAKKRGPHADLETSDLMGPPMSETPDETTVLSLSVNFF